MFFKKKVKFRLLAYLLIASIILTQVNIQSVFALQSNGPQNKICNIDGYRITASNKIEILSDKPFTTLPDRAQFKLYEGVGTSGTPITINSVVTANDTPNQTMTAATNSTKSDYLHMSKGGGVLLTSDTNFTPGKTYTIVMSNTILGGTSFTLGHTNSNQDVSFSFTCPDTLNSGSNATSIYNSAATPTVSFMPGNNANNVSLEGNVWFNVSIPVTNYDDVLKGLVLKRNGVPVSYAPFSTVSTASNSYDCYAPVYNDDHTFFGFLLTQGTSTYYDFNWKPNSTYELHIPEIHTINGQVIPAQTRTWTTMNGDTPNKMSTAVTAELLGHNLTVGWSVLSAGPTSTENSGWPAADGYNVYFSTDPYWNFAKLNSSIITGTTYTADISGLTPNTTYYVRVSPLAGGFEGGMYFGSTTPVKFTTPAVDIAPPVITLLGDSTINIENGSVYTDAGVTIKDNKDNGLVPVVTYTRDGSLVQSIDTKAAGTYVIHYNVSDAAGNPAVELTRTVKVAPAAPAAPIVTNDDTANTVAGMAEGMEYNLDNAGYVAYNAAAFSAINFSGNHTLLVRVAASGTTPAGSATTLTFTTNPLTLVSAVTDHIGKKIILTFDRPMKDPIGTQNQFTVAGKSTVVISGTPNFLTGNIPVTSVALGSDSTQIILSMSTAIQQGPITLSYTKGSVEAADETSLESFTDKLVTNNNICLTDMVDFDYDATEIAYDTSDPSNPILKYKYDKPVDYDNVQLAWYLYNGFFTPMVDDLNNYVKFYEKDTGNNVVLPNILTRGNAPATYKDGSVKNEQIVTDWYFWQLQHYAPLGLNLVSQALKPSTTYVIEIDKGFKFQNGNIIPKTFYFEFTTTADSLTKPYWAAGSSVTTSNITDNSLTLGWPAAQDNHKVTGYNIYENGELLTTVDGDTTSYNVSSLSSGTEYKFKVEALDFADNHSSDCLETTQVTSIAPVPPVAPNVTNDDTANTVAGMAAGMEYNLDNAGYVPYDAAAFSAINFSGNHTLLVRVAASGTTPAGSATTLTFTTNLPSWSGSSTLTAANITENSLKLNWSGVSDNLGVTAYNIYKDGTLIGTVNGSTTSYDVTGLNPNTEYTFKVEAVDGVNNASTTGPSVKVKTLDVKAPTPIGVTYETHVQNIGWQSDVADGQLSGTEGKGLRLEGIKLNLTGDLPAGAGIKYETHVQNIGWQDAVSGGELSGTEGKGLRLEGIKISLENMPGYSIQYRVHVQNIGWQDWVSDGQLAGTEGKGLRLEAIEVRVVKISDTTVGVSYKSQVQNIGWQSNVTNGQLSGTEGQGLRLEGVKINLVNAPAGAAIKYQTHVQNIGWQNEVTDGELSGTEGKGLRLEGIKISLENMPGYKVEYRAHVQNQGWQDWVSDGQLAGTEGKGLRIEALEVRIVKVNN